MTVTLLVPKRNVRPIIFGSLANRFIQYEFVRIITSALPGLSWSAENPRPRLVWTPRVVPGYYQIDRIRCRFGPCLQIGGFVDNALSKSIPT